MANPKNGAMRTLQFALTAAFTTLIEPKNEDGTPKLDGKGRPQQWYTLDLAAALPNGEKVIFVTPAMANKLAQKAGAETTDAVKTAINTSNEDCYVLVTQKWCEVGQPITDDNGQPKLDEDGASIGDYNGDKETGSSYWSDVRNKMVIVLSEDAVEYLRNISRELDILDARDARKAKNASIAKVKGMTGITITKLDDKEEDEEEEEEDLNLATSPTKADMQRANAEAKAAGKPNPYTKAQIAAAE